MHLKYYQSYKANEKPSGFYRFNHAIFAIEYLMLFDTLWSIPLVRTNAAFSSNILLRLACRNNLTNCVRLLLQEPKVKLNAGALNNQSLINAICNNNLEIIKLLCLEQQVRDFIIIDDRFLSLAVDMDNLEMVKFLWQDSPILNMPPLNASHILSAAIENNNQEIFKLLWQNSHIRASAPECRNWALRHAISSTNSFATEILWQEPQVRLVAYKCNLDYLSFAIEMNSLAIIKLFYHDHVFKKMFVNQIDSIISVASQNYDFSFVQVLLENYSSDLDISSTHNEIKKFRSNLIFENNYNNNLTFKKNNLRDYNSCLALTMIQDHKLCIQLQEKINPAKWQSIMLDLLENFNITTNILSSIFKTLPTSVVKIILNYWFHPRSIYHHIIKKTNKLNLEKDLSILSSLYKNNNTQTNSQVINIIEEHTFYKPFFYTMYLRNQIQFYDDQQSSNGLASSI